MRITRSFELMLFFPFFAALCLETFTIETTIYCPSQKMDWTEARLYCQKNYIDLVTWNIVDKFQLAEILLKINVQQAWIGLLRDPGNASVWRWINIKSGKGISGGDLSQSSYWADGEPSSHCAAVKPLSRWYSLTCSDAFGFYCSENSKINYHSNILTWDNASQYCKTVSKGDLATIAEKNTYEFTRTGWIGLYREAGETWSWIGHPTTAFRNWAYGEPLTADCGFYNPEKVTWHSSVCSEKLRFVCYGDDMVVVNENRTWEHALEHCRGMKTPCENSSSCSYDLLSLNIMSEHQLNVSYVLDRINRATSDEVWIGLRFLGGEWWWADGTQLEDKGTLPDCPSRWEHCGTLSKNNKRNWITRDCSERRNFVCYKVKGGLFRADQAKPGQD